MQLGNTSLGDASLGAESSDVYSATLPSVALGFKLLMSTDNGFVIMRQGYNNFRVVFAVDPSLETHGFEHSILYGLSQAQDRCQIVGTYLDCLGGGPTIPITTQNGGDTWSIYEDIIPDSLQTKSYEGYEGLMRTITPSGYTLVEATASGPVRQLWKSDNVGMSSISNDLGTYAAGVSPAHASNGGGGCIAKGYFWWIQAEADELKLFRMAIEDPTTATTFTIPWAANDISESAFFAFNPSSDYPVLKSTKGTNTLIGYSPVRDGVQLSTSTRLVLPIMHVDITDVASPAFTFSAFEPFGAGEYHPADVHVLDDDTMVALVWHAYRQTDHPRSAGFLPNGYNTGSIWKSTDGGLTWTQIIAPTRHLAAGFSSDVVPFIGAFDLGLNPVQSIALGDEASDVWISGAHPWVWHSTDSGDTWVEEYIAPGIFTPYFNPGDRAPVMTYGIVKGCPSPTPNRRGYSRAYHLE